MKKDQESIDFARFFLIPLSFGSLKILSRNGRSTSPKAASRPVASKGFADADMTGENCLAKPQDY